MITFDEEPMSRAAIAARMVAFFAVPVTIVAALVARSGKVDTVPALAAVGAGLFLAVLAILLALLACASIWVKGHRGGATALIALTVGLLILAYPAYLVAEGLALPAINDVTTDVADPPVFRAAVAERVATDNSTVYGGEKLAITQLAAYPQVVPGVTDLSVAEAHGLALQLARDRGWRVIAGEQAPAGNAMAQIEAVASSRLLGLKTDVVIRIRRAGNQSRIDMRAASRFGSRDFGACAELVRAYMSDILAQVR